jgi:hypothetical protein
MTTRSHEVVLNRAEDRPVGRRERKTAGLVKGALAQAERLARGWTLRWTLLTSRLGLEVDRLIAIDARNGLPLQQHIASGNRRGAGMTGRSL